MLDTNIVSEVIKNPAGRVATRLVQQPAGVACISIVTAAELRFGARKVRSDRIWNKITDFTALVPVLPFDHPAEELYAEVCAVLEAAERPIGPNDIFIAAHALALGLTLVTANIGEFSRVPGLKVENWLD